VHSSWHCGWHVTYPLTPSSTRAHFCTRDATLVGSEGNRDSHGGAAAIDAGGEKLAAGTVYLVGAGPGGADLISVRGHRMLVQADVVVSDELADPDLLALARGEVIITGKRGGNKAGSTPQTDINAILVERAKTGATIVRLKGGDPLVFGRVQQEIDALEQAGVPWTIVPGITSALSAAAAAGVSSINLCTCLHEHLRVFLLV
jgi:hypothetical protein